MNIRRLTNCTPQQLHDLSVLMNALTSRSITLPDTLAATLSQSSNHLLIAEEDERIIGCATLCVFCSPTGRKASVEDVVVHPDWQRHGVGRRLVEALIDEAKRLAPITLQLTSRPQRQAARALYASLGFEQKETGFFKLSLE